MMTTRSFRHWTPRYIVDRLGEMLYQRQYPHHPWLTRRAVEFLQAWLKPSDIAVEFGSGRSTFWFAERVLRLTSVEHHSGWYERVSKQLNDSHMLNVTYLLFEENETEVAAASSGYAGVIREIPAASVDIALVDGIFRGYCARMLVKKIQPGGLLVVDNANWYLPCESRSPGSRKAAQGPANEDWAEFLRSVADWRCIWTTSGVTDTALYFKPGI